MKLENPERIADVPGYQSSGQRQGRALLTCAVTGRKVIIVPGVDTVYSVRAELGADAITDEVWVQARDLCAPEAPTSNPRIDNAVKEAPVVNPAVDVDVEAVIEDAPPPVAPPVEVAPEPKAKKGNR
jgi:hypothetical protein